MKKVIEKQKENKKKDTEKKEEQKKFNETYSSCIYGAIVT